MVRVVRFKRPKDVVEVKAGVGELLLQGQAMIEQTAQAHRLRWGLGSSDRWDLDQTTGIIRWTFPEKIAEAPAQLLGTYSTTHATWLWAWGNSSIQPGLREASESVRRWGESNEQPFLTTAQLEVTEEQVADLVAIAFRLTRATGFYRSAADATIPYITFGPVKTTWSDGRTDTFTVNVE